MAASAEEAVEAVAVQVVVAELVLVADGLLAHVAAQLGGQQLQDLNKLLSRVLIESLVLLHLKFQNGMIIKCLCIYICHSNLTDAVL